MTGPTKQDMTNLSKFTAPQIEAITTDHPDVAVLAGPGSGKTTVLCERVKYLIREDGVLPSEMVVITFTNAAAREIESRLDDIRFQYSGTLHGWVLRLLKANGRLIGLPPVITMMTEDDAAEMVKATLASQLVSSKVTMGEVKQALDLGPAFYINEHHERLTEAQCVAAQFYRELRTSGVMTFDALLKFGIMLLEKIHEHTGGIHIPYLFWDEVQDSGADDWRIIELIDAGHSFVVGDPDQSIYGFRGARPDLFTKFTRETGRMVITLAENFRCGAEICGVANALIGVNRGRIPKQTIPARTDSPGDVARWTGFDSDGEVQALAQEIRKQPALHECAVLVRSNKLVEKISAGLRGFSIPVAQNVEGAKPKDWPKARALIALLANPDNDLLMHRYLVRESGKKVADGLKLTAMKARKTLREIIDRSSGAFPAFPNITGAKELPGIMAQHGLSQESIVTVQKAASQLPQGATLAELAHALADADLHTRQEGTGVTVTTIHSAKGREWDAVFCPAFEEGMIPKSSGTADVEEERRIAFVAFTRARNLLVLSWALTRPPLWKHGNPEPVAPSRFVEEAGLSTTC